MASDKNPVTEYLEKKAGAGAEFLSGARGAFKPSEMGSSIGHGALAAGGAAVAGLAAMGMHKLYDAATKTRDFKSMLQYAPDIAEMHAENPQHVGQMFSTLRMFNPDFTRDPVVSSSYVRRMMGERESGGAGGIAVEALESRDKMKHQFSDNVTRAMTSGGGKGGKGGGKGSKGPARYDDETD